MKEGRRRGGGDGNGGAAQRTMQIKEEGRERLDIRDSRTETE